MQLKRWGWAAVCLGLGLVGAIAGNLAMGEYQRYRQLLATTDALVQVVQQNIQAGTIKGLPGPAPAAAPATK